MESMEEVYKAEAEARGKRNKQHREVLEECRAYILAFAGFFGGLCKKETPAENRMREMIKKIDEVLKDE